MDRNFIIPYVIHKPNVGINILSLPQLIQQGLEVDFLESRCVLKPMFDDDEICEKTSSETRNEEIDSGSIQEKLDEMEEIVGKDISRRMLAEYVTLNSDKIGETSNKGSSSDWVGEDMVVPSDLHKVKVFLDQILIGKYAESLEDANSNNFDNLVSWFHKELLECPFEKEIPPLIGNNKVSLMDLFRMISDMGGSGTVCVKGKWEELAMGMGYPKEYAVDFKECYLEYLQRLDLYYNVARKLMEEAEKDCVDWNGRKTKLETNTFEGFKVFMGIMKHNPTAMKYKQLLKNKINDLVEWFHKVYMDCIFEAPLPPQVGYTDICLFDLYVLVESMGGSKSVNEKKEWNKVAMSFGFPAGLKEIIQEIYGKYLGIMDLYYSTIMEGKSTATESRNAGRDESTAEHIDLDEGNGGDMMAGRKEEKTKADGHSDEESYTDENQEDNNAADYEENKTGEMDQEGAAAGIAKDHVNVVYDNGERLVITFDKEDDSDEEPSIVEYYDSEENGSISLDSE